MKQTQTLTLKRLVRRVRYLVNHPITITEEELTALRKLYLRMAPEYQQRFLPAFKYLSRCHKRLTQLTPDEFQRELTLYFYA